VSDDDRKPCEGMTLEAVQHVNPGWECWWEPVPMNGWFYAKRAGYEKLSARDPEDLHIAILRAEAWGADCDTPG
jgi:hypothetical protein